MAERRFKIAVGVLILVALYAALVPWLADVDDRVTDFSAARLAPSFDHPFGTDSAGRDLFVRIAAGIRTSLLIALACALLATGDRRRRRHYGRTGRRLGGQVRHARHRRRQRTPPPVARHRHRRDVPWKHCRHRAFDRTDPLEPKWPGSSAPRS